MQKISFSELTKTPKVQLNGLNNTFSLSISSNESYLRKRIILYLQRRGLQIIKKWEELGRPYMISKKEFQVLTADHPALASAGIKKTSGAVHKAPGGGQANVNQTKKGNETGGIGGNKTEKHGDLRTLNNLPSKDGEILTELWRWWAVDERVSA